MPIKDLIGRPRPTAGEKALEKEFFERRQALMRRRPGHSDDDEGLSPVSPPPGPGPGPMPLAGAAEIADE